MKAWVFLLGGLIVWAAHFFAVYLIGSVLPGTELARWLVLAVTVLGIGFAGAILLSRVRGEDARQDTLEGWSWMLSSTTYALSIIGIIYQGLPALLT